MIPTLELSRLTNALSSSFINGVTFIANASESWHIVFAFTILKKYWNDSSNMTAECSQTHLTSIWKDSAVINDVAIFIVSFTSWAEFSKFVGIWIWTVFAIDGIVFGTSAVAPTSTMTRTATLIKANGLGGRGQLSLKTHTRLDCCVTDMFADI